MTRLGDVQRSETRRETRASLLTALLWFASAVIVFAMLLRMLPNSLDGKRYVPLIVALMPWLGLLSVIIAIIATVFRTVGKRKLLVALSVLCVIIQIIWHWGYAVPTNDRAIQPSATVRVMTFNTKQGCADAQQIVRTIQSEHVEILAMQEVSSGLLDRLHDAGIEDYLPYSVSAQLTWHDNGGVNVLYSAHPLQETTQDLIPIESSSIPAATVDFNGRKVRFGSVHPFSPRPSNQGLWNKSLDSIAQLQHYDNGESYVLMGDFNSTWDHASFRYLLGDRFTDAGESAGEGLHMTYPSVFPIAEIDHIIYDKGVYARNLETKRIQGSDHKALLATLELQ
ncbi:endonuclease/exonuclease/phosphatase family protein [Bifidobacterium pseudocatenulatum]|uniref:Endonuclease/exonuclease/phosphatase family protein n=1 Tax=Bifidobacterium pseudocatenulatum TaxID=28026 RepID=A0ABD4W8N0_BIFPS|nr:endonuclease/exonuclease/phosphatase family protein [Bifidobacterium pseudocatenulatum]MDB6492001.1 endonuclease/exonuclease/phosphatase family protein [Bifidobacterium pseudocatenulatum]MDB6493806.1 endonuclease/exonuclease/phosphatase family protein [Bifidobacterium pseudocatenulatum]MDB6504658.1 endonuclease/exonuclease/phosphatase family protein [Bifidobacterium pseudocatenulatum]